MFYSFLGHFSKKIAKALLALGGGGTMGDHESGKVWYKLLECILGSSVFDQVLISNNLTYNNITITDQITFCCVMKQRKWVCFVIFLGADDHGYNISYVLRQCFTIESVLLDVQLNSPIMSL